MKKVINLLVIVGIVLLATGISEAKAPGKSGATFLKIGMGARVVALGGNYVGLADDINAIYWNPAGLTNIEKKEFLFQYLKPFAKVDNLGCQYLAMCIPNAGLINNLSVGGNITYYGYGKTNKYDEKGNLQGQWDASDFAFTITGAKEVKENLSVGMNGKIIRQMIDDKKGISCAIDIGMLSLLSPNMSYGVVLQNLGTGIKLNKEKSSLPMKLKAGIAYNVDVIPMIILSDVVIPNDNDPYIGLGIEYNLLGVTLRAGYNSNKAKEGIERLSAGFGVGYKTYSFDYAYQDTKELGISHYISFIVKF